MNKKLLIILAAVIGLVVLIAGFLLLSKSGKKGHGTGESSQTAESMVIEADKNSAAQEIIDKEKKSLESDLAKEISQIQANSQANANKPRRVTITKKDIITAEDADMETVLHDVLPSAKASLIYLTLRNMRSRGINPTPILEKFISKELDDPELRKNAVVGLFMIGHDEVIAPLKSTIKLDPDEGVRQVALFCLDFLTRGREIDFFKEVSQTDASAKVREQANEYWAVRSKYQ